MTDSSEAAIRQAHESGDFARAVHVGMSRYRDEVYSFLCARLGSESDAHEVFAQTGEDVWRGIATFRWQCSFRTWLYTLARHAAIRFERSPANQAGRRQTLSRAPDLIDRERSRTRPYLRTDAKDRLAALRATLSPDEQSLLTLRIDRGLSWDDVSRVFYDAPDTDEESIRRHATNLRQRFRQLTQRIREQAEKEGWLEEDG